MPATPITNPGWTCTITGGSAEVAVTGVVPQTITARGDLLLGAGGGLLAIKAAGPTGITLERPAPPHEAGTAPLIVYEGTWRYASMAAAAVSHRVYEQLATWADRGLSIPVLGIANGPPATPAEGDRYLIGTAPSGAWAGRSNQVATWSTVADGGWLYAAPSPGWQVTVTGTATIGVWTGMSWVLGGPGDYVGKAGGQQMQGPLGIGRAPGYWLDLRTLVSQVGARLSGGDGMSIGMMIEADNGGTIQSWQMGVTQPEHAWGAGFYFYDRAGGVRPVLIKRTGVQLTNSLTIGQGGDNLPGSIYADPNWGMYFRAATASPGAAHFAWTDYGGSVRMRLTPDNRLIVSTPTGYSTVEVDGGNSGSSGGSAFCSRLAGIISIAVGNASAIFGGAFSDRPTMYSATSNFDCHGHFLSRIDGGYNLGGASNRWAQVFAVTGTINTSDAREKAWRGGLTEAELRAARRILGGIGIYRWLAAIADKGEEAARLHAGVTAQDVEAAFFAEGLDPARYALWCSDEVLAPATRTRTVTRPRTRTITVETHEIVVEDGVPVRKARTVERQVPVVHEVPVVDEAGAPVLDDLGEPLTHPVPETEEVEETYEVQEPTGEQRLGVRYGELHAFLLAAVAADLDAITARIEALEAA